MLMKWLLGGCGVIAAAVIGLTVFEAGNAAIAQAQRPATFTNEQAEQGRSAYAANCIDCHGANLDDGEFGGAPLKGLSFNQKWGQDTADGLYVYMSTQMPPNAPGSLSARTYANIMAFILRGNGYQQGAELPADPGALANLTMKK